MNAQRSIEMRQTLTTKVYNEFLRFAKKRGDIIGFEITEKSETNLTMLTDVLSYQVLSEE